MKKTLPILLILGLLFGCSSHEKKLKVAATSVPHAEMLEEIKPDLKEKGIDLEIIEVDDYQLPNRLLYEKQVDANFFQHKSFLDLVNKEYGNCLTVLGEIHYEPLGVYSTKIKRIEEIKEGARVAIPCDPSNEARALLLLQSLHLISLKSVPLPTILDIQSNPKSLKIKEIDPPLLPRILPDVEIAVIPANFALQAHLKDGIAFETTIEYPNVLVVRRGEEGREDLKVLIQALRSEKMRVFIQKRYHGAVKPLF
jgi:D-methionine transport system substrate-binding protein